MRQSIFVDILPTLAVNEKPQKALLNQELLVVKKTKLSNCNIDISGYRHSSNLLIAATIILPSISITLHNVPNLLDTTLLVEIMQILGASCSYHNKVFSADTNMLSDHKIPKDLSEQIHGSLYLMPALLARFGKCVFGKSGGCQIGSQTQGYERPVEHVLDVMINFGASVKYLGDEIVVEAAKLNATTIDMNNYAYIDDQVMGPLTSGATKTAILLALSIEEGVTVILNPFLKSETIDLLRFAKLLGFKVDYDSSKIEISYDNLPSNLDYKVISDPSEIITYMCIAGYHEIELCLTNITLERTWPILTPELGLFNKIGLDYRIDSHNVIVKGGAELVAVDIEITPYGICTDHHPLLVALMLKANGASKITEHVWYDRFNYITEAEKFCVSLKRDENSVSILPSKLCHAQEIIVCPDLRAAALLMILALDAPGSNVLANSHHLNRGYVNFVSNLKKMNAHIEMVNKGL